MEDAFREKDEANKELKNVTQQKVELQNQIEAYKNNITALNARIEDGIN